MRMGLSTSTASGRLLSGFVGSACLAGFLMSFSLPTGSAQDSIANPILAQSVQRVVKLFGAGGLGSVESYGSGVVVSSTGHILTTLSPLLEARPIQVVYADGYRADAELVAADPIWELALLKADRDGWPAFPMAHADAALENPDTPVGDTGIASTPLTVQPGDILFALSNQFKIAAGEERVSIQKGGLAQMAPLTIRQGAQRKTYPGEVLYLDINANNPGAGGGAVVDLAGELVGLVGKEVIRADTETWVNYAIPHPVLLQFVQAALTGKLQPSSPTNPTNATKPAQRWALRGIRLLPEVFDKTPAYIDRIEPGSAADQVGLKPDDLILFINQELIQSQTDVLQRFGAAADQPIRLSVRRGDALLEFELPAEKNAANPSIPPAQSDANLPVNK